VVGLVVASLLWRSGPLGDLGLIYTLRGMIIAQVLIAAPLIAGITMAAIQALPAELPDQLLALGANRPQLVGRLWLEARLPLLAAVMAGFGHAVSEVGAATMVGGNIHGQTQVLTTAIVEDVGKGNFTPALAYGAVLLGLAALVIAPSGDMSTIGDRAKIQPAITDPTANAAPMRKFATAATCHSRNRMATDTSSQPNAARISAMGKCTSRGCNRPISVIRRYRPAGGAIYSGE